MLTRSPYGVKLSFLSNMSSKNLPALQVIRPTARDVHDLTKLLIPVNNFIAGHVSVNGEWLGYFRPVTATGLLEAFYAVWKTLGGQRDWGEIREATLDVIDDYVAAALRHSPMTTAQRFSMTMTLSYYYVTLHKRILRMAFFRILPVAQPGAFAVPLDTSLLPAPPPFVPYVSNLPVAYPVEYDPSFPPDPPLPFDWQNPSAPGRRPPTSDGWIPYGITQYDTNAQGGLPQYGPDPAPRML